MPRLRHRIRLVAALLAWAGMLALPLRSLAACPMLGEAASATSTHHGVPVDADEHAGHDMVAAESTAPEAPTSPGAPEHESCPDLAHCAVAAIPAPLATDLGATTPMAALRIAPLTAPLSVARALEPPPPKF